MKGFFLMINLNHLQNIKRKVIKKRLLVEQIMNIKDCFNHVTLNIVKLKNI